MIMTKKGLFTFAVSALICSLLCASLLTAPGIAAAAETEIRFEFEDLTMVKSDLDNNGSGDINDNIAGVKVRSCMFHRPYNEITYQFTLEKAGIYEAALSYVADKNTPILQITIDETAMGMPFDTYKPAGTSWEQKEEALGKIALSAGTHTVTIQTLGKNPDSEYFLTYLDYLKLVKTGDYQEPKTVIYEAEADGNANIDLGGAAWIDNLTNSGDGWTVATFNISESNSVKLKFDVAQSGIYVLEVSAVADHDLGSFCVKLDGTPVGDVFNCTREGGWKQFSRNLIKTELKAGDHELEFYAKDTGATEQKVYLDYLKLYNMDIYGEKAEEEPVPTTTPGETEPPVATGDAGTVLPYIVVCAVLLAAAAIVMRSRRNGGSRYLASVCGAFKSGHQRQAGRR